MQEDIIPNNINTSTPAPEAVVITPQPVKTNDQQPKASNFLVILLSILLFLSITIAGFFAYQTQKLVKELTLLETETTPSPEATTEPTIEPVLTASPTATSSASPTSSPIPTQY